MAINTNVIKGKISPIQDRVLVTDMHFGEQRSKGGLILSDDNGTTRGIYPRWAKVHSVGSKNQDEIRAGQWILVEHGRWTRGILVDEGEGEIEIRMVEAESILGVSDEKPSDISMAKES